ncbi:hypothetical protein KIN20_032474 [Parelaphostrongylus tenuis]|uniref:Uncharacterized protein n=1 Tax=Parelaphostrongylus tenuis TaxID=148309 RepID=A0AAD5WHR1_PARTN|nr:hypothetical protein KIN20_032474 [Parelaphostrongylus tenuis]
MKTGQVITHVELFSRQDYNTLNPSDVICPGKCFQPPCAQRERCTPSERNSNEEEKERSEGDNFSQWSHYVNSSSGSEFSGAEQSGDGPRGGWSVREVTRRD